VWLKETVKGLGSGLSGVIGGHFIILQYFYKYELNPSIAFVTLTLEI